MVASDSFAEFLREQLAPLGHITVRRMFGKTGVFCDGLMLAMVTDDTLYFRVDDDNREALSNGCLLIGLAVLHAQKSRTCDRHSRSSCERAGQREPRFGRRTALTLPLLFPPPQKN
jgi:TfoX N-terminal domain